MSIIGSLVALEAALPMTVSPCGCVLAADGLVLWAVVDTEQLDRLTAVAHAFIRASTNVRHVVSVKTFS